MPLSTIDYGAMKFWLDIAHWIALIILAVWGYLRTKDNDNVLAVKSVAQELANFIKASTEAKQEQQTRITVLEEAVKHMPTDQEVAQIANDVASMRSRLEGQSQLLQRVEHQTSLIHEHLLNKAR
jgi:hypothetical protein